MLDLIFYSTGLQKRNSLTMRFITSRYKWKLSEPVRQLFGPRMQ